MKLYYHKTDDGAEYYCLTHLDGSDEGDFNTAIMRTDRKDMNRDAIEIFLPKVTANGMTFIQRYCTPENA